MKELAQRMAEELVKPYGFGGAAPVRRANKRPLRLEILESRYALSSLIAGEMGACLPTTEAAPADAGSALFPVAAESAPQDGSQEFVGPLEADAYYKTFNEAETAPIAPAQEGEDTAAPTLEWFGSRREGMYWILEGKVTDDEPTMYTRVYFDGAIQTSTVVMSDGTFMHYAFYNPELKGRIVTAVAIDADGNESNMMTAIL